MSQARLAVRMRALVMAWALNGSGCLAVVAGVRVLLKRFYAETSVAAHC